jgi:cytidylate kinase
MSKNLIVAIDGPAGSGKSTSAKLVAQKLGYLYIDTGAMYRAITFLSIKKKLESEKDIVGLAESADINLKFEKGYTEVIVNNNDITDELRTYEVNKKVSIISKIEGVRKALVKKQREYAARNTGIVMEGRDIGTIVFPEADVKIFLTATLEQRVDRRVKEYKSKGISIPVENIKENLIQRDRIDSTREVSPLAKAADAVEIDTSSVTIEEQVELIINEVKKKAEFIKSS